MLFNLKDIECKFDNKIVLKKLSLIINKGQHLLIHGDSGSGKTTLLNHILSFQHFAYRHRSLAGSLGLLGQHHQRQDAARPRAQADQL